MTYAATKFKVARTNGLAGYTFTRNVRNAQMPRRMDGRVDGRQTDFDTKLIYPFFLKKKAGITKTSVALQHVMKNVHFCNFHFHINPDNG